MSSVGLLKINLGAIVSNWASIQSRLKRVGSCVECGAVVKANAYGLGVIPVAAALQKAGCDRFFVATLREGVELRESLDGKGSIVVLSGLSHGLADEWFTHQLTPVLFDLTHINLWVDYCDTREQKLPCALKVNTGMNRLGIEPSDILSFLNSSFDVESIQPEILMSHLVCADDINHQLNETQLYKFRLVAEKIKKFYPKIKLSLSNSSGSFLSPDYYFDICRPGAALYGVNPTPHADNPMQPVVSLSLPVIQERIIAKGEVVGYGATFVAPRKMRIATVFGGYADGLLRLLSNSGYGWCQGVRVPIVGRVSMDSMVFDVTEVKGVSGAIEVLNRSQGVDDLARCADTIGYEVLTSLGKRYDRQYIAVKAEA